MFTQRGGVCNGTDIVILNFMLDWLSRMVTKTNNRCVGISENNHENNLVEQEHS